MLKKGKNQIIELSEFDDMGKYTKIQNNKTKFKIQKVNFVCQM